MTEPIRLARVRKEKARAVKERLAAENRARHGLSKEERARIEHERERTRRTLDGARKEPPAEAT